MRIAYLECFSGISGDMFLGALVDAGVSPGLLEETVAALGVGARLEISRVNAAGSRRPRWMCRSHGEKDLPREEFWAKQDVSRDPPSTPTTMNMGIRMTRHHHEHSIITRVRVSELRGQECPRHMSTTAHGRD